MTELSRKNSSLTFHAVERVLERSVRAPSWLAEVLTAGQYAHLKLASDERTRYVLVFDALLHMYLVPVLNNGTHKVITVLTLEQYQRTHGQVAPVMLQLSQVARARGVELAKAPPTEQEVLAEKRRRLWASKWQVVLTLRPAGRKKDRLRIYLDRDWRQQCVTATFDAIDIASRGADNACELPFPRQAELLAHSPAFLGWVAQQVTRHGCQIDDLSGVTVVSNLDRKDPVDLAAALLAQLPA